MNTLRKYPLLLCLLLAVLLLTAIATRVSLAQIAAPQAPSYAIPWWTSDGGGGGGYTPVNGYVLEGTIAQPDAAVVEQNPYQLTGGYWGGIAPDWLLYLPVVRKSQ
jgi:hypothetical protein